MGRPLDHIPSASQPHQTRSLKVSHQPKNWPAYGPVSLATAPCESCKGENPPIMSAIGEISPFPFPFLPLKFISL